LFLESSLRGSSCLVVVVSGDGIVTQVIQRWSDTTISTHYDGCWEWHPHCAIAILADEIAAERAEVARLRAAGDALAEALRVDGVTFGCSCLWDDEGTPECVAVGRPHPPRRPSRTAAALAVWEARRER
jgi:hypothetical protein